MARFIEHQMSKLLDNNPSFREPEDFSFRLNGLQKNDLMLIAYSLLATLVVGTTLIAG